MRPSQTDVDEVLHQAHKRQQRIQQLENRLAAERELRAIDASWLVRNTVLTRTAIAAVLGTSRVTLDKYLADAGVTDEYLAEVRAVQKERGMEPYNPDISRYLVGFPGETLEEQNDDDE